MSKPTKELPTTERLAHALESLGDPKLFGMIALAYAGYYDDFKSELAFPMLQLVQDLEKMGHPDMAALARNGEFDATEAEATAWKKSKGRAIVTELMGKIR